MVGVCWLRVGHVADSCVCYSVRVWIYMVFSGSVDILEKRNVASLCMCAGLASATLSTRACFIVYGFRYVHCRRRPDIVAVKYQVGKVRGCRVV